MGEHDDELVMESTTDSPEQIADGLGLPAPAEEPVADETADVQPIEEAVSEDPALEDADGVEEPPFEVTPEPARVVAPKRAPRPQRKTVDGAAAAARRTASAKLTAENEALKARLAELTGVAAGEGAIPERPAYTPASAVAPPPQAIIRAEQVPDEHPEVQAALAVMATVGERPKQADFDDFDKFDDATEAWRDKRSSARTRVELVREDVARRATAMNVEAFRAGHEMVQRFEGAETQARSRYADYDTVMAAARTMGDKVRVSVDVTRALLESPVGADLKYYLAKYPAEIARINRLPPQRQLAELGKIEGRIEAAVTPDGQLTARGTRPTARITRAPEPVSAVLGDRPSVARRKDLNDPNLTQAEYNELRNRMDEESGRRPRVVALSR